MVRVEQVSCNRTSLAYRAYISATRSHVSGVSCLPDRGNIFAMGILGGYQLGHLI